MIIHIVTKGESVYGIARRLGASADAILTVNQITNPERLVPGQALVIPGDFFQREVRSGETLSGIALDYGVTLSALLDANPQIQNPNRIQPGQLITIPAAPKKLGTIWVNGYLYPGVTASALEKTLPHLTSVSPFSHMVLPGGGLTELPDEAVLAAARQAGAAPLLVVTNMEPGAGFSGALAHGILTDPTAQSVLLEKITAVMKAKGYRGLNLDFEYLYPEDRENYNRFIQKAAETLHPMGYLVAVALAPKLSADQKGTLYEAHDYETVGALADLVILMTYEWGYLYGPAMAVAPIGPVKKVLDYAVSAMPSGKILMGMPNYGYDWTLPFVKGSAARLLSNSGAVSLAARVGSAIRYDAKSQAPYFNYYDSSGRQHEVWFDDARSIQARLALVSDYELGGVSYWTVDQYFAPNWAVLESMYGVKKL